ncbi:hypothetical protein P8452_73781 [Trifolium repens]|nr:hypothetical protein P8452_73781 [Trifolium repens]
MLQSIPTLSLNLVDFTVLYCRSLETVLSSKEEPYDKPNPSTVILYNCKELDPHSYQTVLNNAIAGIELGATGEDNNTITCYLICLAESVGSITVLHKFQSLLSFLQHLPIWLSLW